MVWLRPLKLTTRLLELVASERSRCVEYLGALPFPGRTREGDERRVPMDLAGEWKGVRGSGRRCDAYLSLIHI